MDRARPLPTDTLVEQAAAGDPAAVDALCGRLQSRLAAWARGRLPPYARDLIDTDDLVQATMVRSLRRLPLLEDRGAGSFLRYLRTGILNGIRNEIKRAKRRGAHVELNPDIPYPARTAIEEMLRREDEERYVEALSKLKPKEQDLVIARIELQMSSQEIADYTGSPTADAARTAARRAILKLADLLRADDKES
jgi:RNA polymerase sigma-70 factor (ECF subfamily)